MDPRGARGAEESKERDGDEGNVLEGSGNRQRRRVTRKLSLEDLLSAPDITVNPYTEPVRALDRNSAIPITDIEEKDIGLVVVGPAKEKQHRGVKDDPWIEQNVISTDAGEIKRQVEMLRQRYDVMEPMVTAIVQSYAVAGITERQKYLSDADIRESFYRDEVYGRLSYPTRTELDRLEAYLLRCLLKRGNPAGTVLLDNLEECRHLIQKLHVLARVRRAKNDKVDLPMILGSSLRQNVGSWVAAQSTANRAANEKRQKELNENKFRSESKLEPYAFSVPADIDRRYRKALDDIRRRADNEMGDLAEKVNNVLENVSMDEDNGQEITDKIISAMTPVIRSTAVILFSSKIPTSIKIIQDVQVALSEALEFLDNEKNNLVVAKANLTADKHNPLLKQMVSDRKQSVKLAEELYVARQEEYNAISQSMDPEHQTFPALSFALGAPSIFTGAFGGLSEVILRLDAVHNVYSQPTIDRIKQLLQDAIFHYSKRKSFNEGSKKIEKALALAVGMTAVLESRNTKDKYPNIRNLHCHHILERLKKLDTNPLGYTTPLSDKSELLDFGNTRTAAARRQLSSPFKALGMKAASLSKKSNSLRNTLYRSSRSVGKSAKRKVKRFLRKSAERLVNPMYAHYMQIFGIKPNSQNSTNDSQLFHPVPPEVDPLVVESYMRKKDIERQELERQELERRELERQELERQELERRELERQELERQELENQELERMKKRMESKQSRREEKPQGLRNYTDQKNQSAQMGSPGRLSFKSSAPLGPPPDLSEINRELRARYQTSERVKPTMNQLAKAIAQPRPTSQSAEPINESTRHNTAGWKDHLNYENDQKKRGGSRKRHRKTRKPKQNHKTRRR